MFWVAVLFRKIPIPKGRTLVQIFVFGLLSVGIAYALLYRGLLQVSAGLTMTTLAFVPLVTFFLAILHGRESFRWRGLFGALVSIAGILVAVRSRLGEGIHLPSLLMVAAAACVMSEGNVFFKFIPRTDPVMTNALATTSGAFLLFVISRLAGETWSVPVDGETWAAYLYLVLVGSVLLYYLYLFVLSRWTASATSYAFLLFPISTVIIAAVISGEAVTINFILGVVLVMVGVWVGVLR